MSYVPSHAMKHAHVAPDHHDAPPPGRHLVPVAKRDHPPLWTMIAAGVVGAVATAALLSLRASTPAQPRKRGRKGTGRKKKSS